MKVFASVISLFSLLINLFLPVLSLQNVYAEDATPSAEVIEATPSAIEATPALSDLTENVVLDKEYVAPQNDKVRIKFNKLPNPSGTISIKEIKLTPEQIKQTGALSDTAYDITSSMQNGTFEYTLTLPTTKTENVEVKVSEDGNNFDTVGGVSAQSDTLTITGLNHFTIFVITGTITEPGPDTFVGESFDETGSSAVINEFVYDPSTGNEWIELFNKTGDEIDLEDWSLVDGNGNPDDLTLSGTIPVGGILVFEKSGGDGWLNNTGSESITLKNSGDQTVDVVSYKDSSFVNGQNIGNVAEDKSVCRTADGGASWQACASPTKGWFNGAGGVGQAPLLSTIDSTLHTAGIESNIGELTNPSSTPATEGTGALYFEKTGQGKIVFEKVLNLSDQETVAILQSLGTAMEMSDGHIKFDSDTADAMNATGAKIYMYGLTYDSTPDIIIKDDDENILGRNDPDAVANISYISETGILSFDAQHFTQFDLPDPADIAAVAGDKEALVADSIKGNNPDLDNITVALTNPLPSLGAQGSTINWASSNTSIVSSNGQTINRPAFADGDTTVTMTATITKNLATDTNTFTLTVLKSPASIIDTITSGSYTVDSAANTITNVPFGTAKATFEAALIKGESHQTWDDVAINNPVVTGDTLVVTAQDGATTRTYTITVNADPDIALVASDKAELVADSIKGSNSDLSNITGALTNPLPSTGSNGSAITWASNNTSVVSNNGQTVVRPVFGAGNSSVTLTATITKGAISDTKAFTLTVLESLNPAKAITAFSFSTGIGIINETGHTIAVNVPFGTDVTALVATFTNTGAGITIGGVSQVSNTTANNFSSPKTYRVTALDGTTQDYVVTVTVLAATQTAPSETGTATANSTTPEVVITDPDQEVTVTVDGSTEATIDVSSFVTGGTGSIPQITIDSVTADIIIPATTVTGPAGWDGVIAAPIVTTVDLPSSSTLGSAIEIGFASDKLSFNNAVRILLPNQAGKKVGYSRPGIAFTEITNMCAADNQATGDLLAADSECKIDVGLDLVIWTKHFTKFASYTQTTSSSGNSGSTGSDGGDGLSDGLGCASHDCSVHPAAVAVVSQSQALASAINFTEEVLGTTSTDVESTPSAPIKSGSAVLSAEQTPSPTVKPNPAPAGSLVKPLAIGAIIVAFFIFVAKFFIFK